jgi:hypothetical protein
MKQAETSADFHLITLPLKVGRRFAATCRPFFWVEEQARNQYEARKNVS